MFPHKIVALMLTIPSLPSLTVAYSLWMLWDIILQVRSFCLNICGLSYYSCRVSDHWQDVTVYFPRLVFAIVLTFYNLPYFPSNSFEAAFCL